MLLTHRPSLTSCRTATVAGSAYERTDERKPFTAATEVHS